MPNVILPDNTEVEVLTDDPSLALAAAEKYWERHKPLAASDMDDWLDKPLRDVIGHVMSLPLAEMPAGAAECLKSREEPAELEEPIAPQARLVRCDPDNVGRLHTQMLDDGSVVLSVPHGAPPQALNIRVQDGVAVITPLEDDLRFPAPPEAGVLDI